MAKKVAGNVDITYNSNALDGYLNTSSMNAVVNAIQTTDFDSTGEESIAGLPTWTASVGGPWDATLDGYLGPDAVSPPTTLRTLVVEIDSVTYTWTANAFISGYTIDASSPSEGITWSGELTCSGVPVRS
ncbi:MAG: hypothetical protein WBO46_14955 [Caldilineaceae bacterium]